MIALVSCLLARERRPFRVQNRMIAKATGLGAMRAGHLIPSPAFQPVRGDICVEEGGVNASTRSGLETKLPA